MFCKIWKEVEFMNAIVLGIRPWKLDNEKEGLSVHYIDPELAQEEGFIGIQPLKASIDADDIRKFTKVPGVYDMSFKMKPTAKGSIIMKLDKVEFLHDYEFVI
jgi:hypothetical protein